MPGGKILNLTIHIAGKLDNSLTAAINGTQSKLDGITKNISRMGTAGLAAMGSLAAGTAATIVSCTKEATKFANDMGNVTKYVEGLADKTGKINPQKYNEMSKAIRDLSTQIPYTQKELTEMAASAGQSGKTMTDLIEGGFLKDVAMMGTAMDIPAAQAGDWAAKWEVAFNKSHSEIMELADQINYLGANNATTAAEIGDVVNEVASFGQIAGMSESATAALGTAMLAMGVNSKRTATSISRMYTNLNSGASATKKQKEMWESMGMTAEGVAVGMQKDATGTLISVFEAIRKLPEENRVSALSTLFGQWAIQAGGKLTGNLEVFEKALADVQNPEKYKGSMMREFVIKAETPEAVFTMLSNSVSALKGEIGDSFLPVQKEFSLMMIDLIGNIRENMPQIQQLAQTFATLLSTGVSKAGDALQAALPYIQQFLDYLVNNGPEAASIVGKIAAGFAAMKFAPGIANIAGGAKSLLFGEKDGAARTGGFFKNAFVGGRNAAGKAGGAIGAMASGAKAGTAGVNGGLKQTLLNGIVGAVANLRSPETAPTMIADMKLNGAGGIFRQLFGEARDAAANTGPGKYISGIASAFGNLKNTKIGSGITGGLTKTGSVAKEIISGILGSEGTGFSDLAKGVFGFLKDGAGNLAGKAGGKISGAFSAAKNSVPVKIVGGALGKAGNFAGGILGNIKDITGSSLGGLIGSGLGNIGNFAGAGLGLMNSVTGFMGLFTGAAPIIATISGIIAVVSILGDHLEDIRGIVGNVFGDAGLAVFDSFMGKLSAVGDFITGLFADGGVANALAPLRENLVNLFGDKAGAAFDGLTQVLQSVMGVIGQLVSFSTGTVKPIIQDIFQFITGTVVPIILQTFTAAAPTISAIIDNLGTAIMTGMQIIGGAIQAAMPFIQGIINAFMTIGSVVIPAALSAFEAFSQGISAVVTAIQGVFNGIIDFVTGIFTSNWSLAWEGVRTIFINAFNGLAGIVKAPINAVIALINKAISGINGLNLDIPDWVPGIGGNKFGISLPEIPMLAKGGFTHGPSIAGEAGTEAVISFQRGVRAQNIATWTKAGKMLDIDKDSPPPSGKGGSPTFVFSPQITIQGGSDLAELKRKLEELLSEFEPKCMAVVEKMQRYQARTGF